MLTGSLLGLIVFSNLCRNLSKIFKCFSPFHVQDSGEGKYLLCEYAWGIIKRLVLQVGSRIFVFKNIYFCQ